MMDGSMDGWMEGEEGNEKKKKKLEKRKFWKLCAILPTWAGCDDFEMAGGVFVIPTSSFESPSGEDTTWKTEIIETIWNKIEESEEGRGVEWESG